MASRKPSLKRKLIQLFDPVSSFHYLKTNLISVGFASHVFTDEICGRATAVFHTSFTD